jgi:hypothetical protein
LQSGEDEMKKTTISKFRVLRTLVGDSEWFYLRPYVGEDVKQTAGWVDDPSWAALLTSEQAMGFKRLITRKTQVFSYEKAIREYGYGD